MLVSETAAEQTCSFPMYIMHLSFMCVILAQIQLLSKQAEFINGLMHWLWNSCNKLGSHVTFPNFTKFL